MSQPVEVTPLMWFRMALDVSRGVAYLHGRSPALVRRDCHSAAPPFFFE